MGHDPIPAIRGVSFFKDLSPSALKVVAARMVHRPLPTGCILFRAGEQSRGTHVLTAGCIEIYRGTPDGKEQVLHTELPVQSIAELPLFDGGAYPASARATEPSEIFFLSVDDFQRLYREHPEIADAVIKNLGQRLRALVALVEKVSLKSVPGRVAATLLEAAERAGVRGDGGRFRLRRTQSELAHELATSRESVARALGGFRRRKLIRSEGRDVVLLSVRGLEEVARDRDHARPARSGSH